MKKLLLMAGLLAATVSTRAQFFQWVYGDNTFPWGYEELYNGVRMTTTDKGSIMAGFSKSGLGVNLYVVKADLNGKTMGGPPYFNNIYPLYDVFGNSFTVIESKILEFKDGSGYAAAGWFTNNATGMPGIYFFRLDVNGNPMTGRYYQFGSTTSSGFRMGHLREDPTGQYVYITGSVYNPIIGNWDVFIQKVDQNGTLTSPGTWTVTYNLFHPNYNGTDDMGWDVMESLYSPEVLVVGSVKDISGNPADAFVLKLKSTTGSFGAVCYYGDPNTEDEFRSINHSFAPIGGTKGYIVGGSTNFNSSGDYNFWTMRLDPNLSPQWSTIHDYNGLSYSPNNYCNMVIERLNTFGKYEFYAVGRTDDGVFGGQDVQVVKTDDMGWGVGNGQFTYGGPGNDRGAAVDQDNSGTSDGLYVYASTEGSFSSFGGSDYYYIKAYYNGYDGCNDKIMDPKTWDGPWILTKGDYTFQDKMPDDDIKWDPPTKYDEHVLCHNSSLPWGDNSLQTQVKGADLSTKDIAAGDAAVVITPNPAEGTSTIQLDVIAPAGTIEVIVADYMGRQYINQRFDIRDGGRQTLSVELGKANLTPGLYLLKVNGLDKPSSQVLIVK